MICERKKEFKRVIRTSFKILQISTLRKPPGSVALRRVFDLKVSELHLTEINLKVWVINGEYFIDVSICKIELRDELFLSNQEQRL